MSSFLTQTFTTTISVALPPGTARPTVIRLLHDHPLIIELSPLLVRSSRVDDDEAEGKDAALAAPQQNVDKYNFTEKLSYLPWGLWDSELNVWLEFMDTEAGVRTTARAPLGFVSEGDWVVKEGEGVLVLEETVKATCPVGLRWFVEGTMRRSHETLLARFVERLEGERGGADG